MTTKEQLESALKDAMRAKDDLRKRTLRMALAAIQMAEVQKRLPLDEAGVTAILQKEVKLRQEALSEARQAQRPDLEQAAQDELGVLEIFLPRPFSPEELEALVRQAITEAGATSLKEMGPVMRLLAPRLQGRATGEQANQVVRKILNG